MADFVGPREKWPKKRRPRGQKIYKRNNICSIVLIVVNYLDNNITIIFLKFQALVTSITGKVIDVSGKKPNFEIIKVENKGHKCDNSGGGFTPIRKLIGNIA